MLKQTNELIEEFYNQMEDKYGLSLEQVARICKFPFTFFREKIALYDLPLIKIKYFGKFVVYPGKVLGMLRNIEKKYQAGKCSKETYEQTLTNLNTYIENNPKLFKTKKNEAIQDAD